MAWAPASDDTSMSRIIVVITHSPNAIYLLSQRNHVRGNGNWQLKLPVFASDADGEDKHLTLMFECSQGSQGYQHHKVSATSQMFKVEQLH